MGGDSLLDRNLNVYIHRLYITWRSQETESLMAWMNPLFHVGHRDQK